MPALHLAREQGKRAACLSNLKQLTFAWIMYADENDDKLVCGDVEERGDFETATGMYAVGYGHYHERPWVLKDWPRGSVLNQKIAVEGGALFPYCKNEKLYRCPTGVSGEMRTYTIGDSMNGIPRSGTHNNNTVGVRVGRTVLWIKKRTEIVSPGPAYRLVFLDEGRITPDSYATHYVNERWWDPPFVRHGDGTNVSFADGHADYWKYMGRKTIETGKLAAIPYLDANPLHQMQPESPDDFEDLHKMQKAIWGRLGY
ncbi:hypothetical protein ES703_95696 [subsurface metagenome]